MVVRITKYRIEKTNPYLKYFLNQKIFFCLSDFTKHLEKPLNLLKNHMARSQTYTLRSTKESDGSESNLHFATIATILKSSFLFSFSSIF